MQRCRHIHNRILKRLLLGVVVLVLMMILSLRTWNPGIVIHNFGRNLHGTSREYLTSVSAYIRTLSTIDSAESSQSSAENNPFSNPTFESDSALNMSLYEDVLSAARSVLETSKGPLLVTIINDGYLSLTFNWLCHTAHLQDVHNSVLMLTEDTYTQEQMRKRWPNIRTVCIESSNSTLRGQLVFGTVGYVRMMVRRTNILNAILAANLSVVLFETDFVWFRNPVPDFVNKSVVENLDLVGTKTSVPDQTMCGGLIYFRNTPRTRLLWAEVTHKMHRLEKKIAKKRSSQNAPYKQNEQRYLNHLLKHYNATVHFGLVSYSESVADGAWYGLSKTSRHRLHPKTIHNNFRSSVEAKVRRFQRFGQWFLTDDLTCDKNRVPGPRRRFLTTLYRRTFQDLSIIDNEV